MHSRKHCVFFLFLIVALCSCASQSQIKQKLLSGETPRYEGIITPISIPIRPEFKPVRQARFIQKSLTTTLSNGKTEEASTEGSFKVSEMGQLLIWDIKLLKLKTGGRYYSANLPLAEARALTDRYGNMKEIELAFPAFEQLGIDVKKETAKYISLTDYLKYQFQGFSAYSDPFRTPIPIIFGH